MFPPIYGIYEGSIGIFIQVCIHPIIPPGHRHTSNTFVMHILALHETHSIQDTRHPCLRLQRPRALTRNMKRTQGRYTIRTRLCVTHCVYKDDNIEIPCSYDTRYIKGFHSTHQQMSRKLKYISSELLYTRICSYFFHN